MHFKRLGARPVGYRGPRDPESPEHAKPLCLNMYGTSSDDDDDFHSTPDSPPLVSSQNYHADENQD